MLKKSSFASATPSPAPLLADQLIVYLDTSASMAGYLKPDGTSTFGRALRELRYVAGTFNDPSLQVLVRYVTDTVGPTQSDSVLTSASQDTSHYSGQNTDLAGAIESFKQSNETQNNNSEMNLKNKTPRFHILVTDGVQSGSKEEPAQGCQKSSDQFCVRQKVHDLLKNGWSGCILGLRGDFSGTIYSEATKGQKINYDSTSGELTTYRPFYFYIFSQDAAGLQKLTETLKEHLRLLQPEGSTLHELNLSFPYQEDQASVSDGILGISP